MEKTVNEENRVKQGIEGKAGKDGRDGRDGRDGIDGRDGSQDTAEDIRNKLELLSGEERLDGKYIKGFENLSRIPDIERMAQYNAMPVTTSFFNGLRAKNMTIDGATAYQLGDTVHITGITSGGGGGSGVQLPTSGAVNGSNHPYTFATAPKHAMNVDGSIYFKTTQDASATAIWTGTTTITFINLTPNTFCGAVA